MKHLTRIKEINVQKYRNFALVSCMNIRNNDPSSVASFIRVEQIPTQIEIISKVGSCPSSGGARSALADIISRVSDSVFVCKQTADPRETGDTVSRT